VEFLRLLVASGLVLYSTDLINVALTPSSHNFVQRTPQATRRSF
jgi:hypothetical protein